MLIEYVDAMQHLRKQKERLDELMARNNNMNQKITLEDGTEAELVKVLEIYNEPNAYEIPWKSSNSTYEWKRARSEDVARTPAGIVIVARKIKTRHEKIVDACKAAKRSFDAYDYAPPRRTYFDFIADEIEKALDA